MLPLAEKIQEEKIANKLSKLQKEIFPYESLPLKEKEASKFELIFKTKVSKDISLLGRKMTRSVYRNLEKAESMIKDEDSNQTVFPVKQESSINENQFKEASKESGEKIKIEDKPEGLLNPEHNIFLLNQELKLKNPNIVFEYKLKEIMPNVDYGPRRIRLGICCLNNYLRSQKDTVTCSRTLTLATYLEKGKKLAMERALANVNDILRMLKWNKAHHIEVMRVSSGLFPHFTNIWLIPESKRYNLDFAREALKQVGQYAISNKMRLTFHPGHFNILASPNEKIVEKTTLDLKMHADIFDIMGLDGNSILTIHGGATYGDKESAINRWIGNYEKLPDNVKNRLVLENCEKNFSIEDCLKVHRITGVPIVFDNHHFNVYKANHPLETFKDIRSYIREVMETWLKKGLRPKFHISEQDVSRAIGAHSEFINNFPEYYLEIPEKYRIGVDIMVEAGAKEAAIIKLYKKHKNHFLNHIEEKELPKDFFEIDNKLNQAKNCSRCKLSYK